MWKWLILVAAGYLLYRMFINDRTKKAEVQKENKENLVATGELVKDPICGSYIDADSSITVRDGETVHRFCSYECRDSFLTKIGKMESKTLAQADDNK